MTISRLKWIAMLAPILFLALIEAGDELLLEPRLGAPVSHVIKLTFMVVGAIVFSTLIFQGIERVQSRLTQRNRELVSLDNLGRSVTGSSDLHQELTAALGEVMRITSSIAGRILVDGYAETDMPTYVTLGNPEAFAGLPQDISTTTTTELRIATVRSPLALSSSTVHRYRVATVPLVALDKTIGSLWLIAAEGKLDEQKESFLSAIGHQLGVAIQASHLFRDVERRREESQALYELGLRIASLEDPSRVLDLVVEQAKRLLDVDRAGLCVTSAAEDGGPAASEHWELWHMSPNDMSGNACKALEPEFRRFSISSPIRLGGRTVGHLSVGCRSARSFSHRDRVFLDSIADMAALALGNARMLTSERQVAILEERERLSRELHDNTAQALGYLHLKALTLARSASGDSSRVVEDLKEMASVAKEALADVREAILGLREAPQAEGNFVEFLRGYVEKFSRQSRIAVRFELPAGEPPALSRDAELQVIRVVQEALANVRKHSGADSAWVTVAREGDDVVIIVGDAGTGFDLARAEAGRHTFGIRSMRERVARVGGQLNIESQMGVGTRVEIRIRAEDGGLHGEDSHYPGRRSDPVSQGPSRAS